MIGFKDVLMKKKMMQREVNDRCLLKDTIGEPTILKYIPQDDRKKTSSVGDNFTPDYTTYELMIRAIGYDLNDSATIGYCLLLYRSSVKKQYNTMG